MSKDSKEKLPVKAAPDFLVSKDPGYETITDSFITNCTIHGLSRLGGSTSTYRRGIWLVLFLGSFVFLIYGIKVNLYKMCEHRVVMKTALKHNTSLPFPAFTVCNANAIRKSKAGETVLHDFFKYADQGKNANVDTSQRVDFMESFIISGHDIRDMLKSCVWNGQQCGPENFTIFFDMKVGKCYSFNSHKSKQLIAEDGQCNANLILTLDAQPEEYHDPWNDRVGFRVQLHEPGKPPDLFRRGQFVTPGFSYDMAVTRHKTILLPEPFPSGCIKDTAEKYSTLDCRNECWDRVASEKCNCTLSGMKRSSLCTIEQATCLLQTKAKPVGCPCPPPCVSVTYKTDLSGAVFPAPHQWPFILQEYNISNSSEAQPSKENFRERYVKLSVYYRTTGTKEWEEMAAYDLDNFFCDLGGMMGLCLGCSLMSVLELLDLFVSLSIYFANKPKSTKVQHYQN